MDSSERKHSKRKRRKARKSKETLGPTPSQVGDLVSANPRHGKSKKAKSKSKTRREVPTLPGRNPAFERTESKEVTLFAPIPVQGNSNSVAVPAPSSTPMAFPVVMNKEALKTDEEWKKEIEDAAKWKVCCGRCRCLLSTAQFLLFVACVLFFIGLLVGLLFPRIPEFEVDGGQVLDGTSIDFRLQDGENFFSPINPALIVDLDFPVALDNTNFFSVVADRVDTNVTVGDLIVNVQLENQAIQRREISLVDVLVNVEFNFDNLDDVINALVECFSDGVTDLIFDINADFTVSALSIEDFNLDQIVQQIECSLGDILDLVLGIEDQPQVRQEYIDNVTKAYEGQERKIYYYSEGVIN